MFDCIYKFEIMSNVDNIKNSTTVKLTDFIVGRIDDLEILINDTEKTSAYLKFQVIPQYIEFLGACLDHHDFDSIGKAKTRFKSIIEKYFDEKYKKHSDTLYLGFRCGMIHQLRPTCKIGLTTKKEANTDGTDHLEKWNGYDLILVLEELFDDLKVASEKVCKEIDTMQEEQNKQLEQKWKNAFITVTN